MNILFRKSSPLMKTLLKIKHNNKKDLYKYLKLTPNFSSKFRLVKDPAESLRDSLPKIEKEQLKKPSFNTQSDFKNMKYPLIINSPLISGISLVLLQSVFIGGEIPELSKFIVKSTFLYGAIFTGLNLGIRVQADEKIKAGDFNEIKKKFFLLAGVLGISQTLGAVALPLPIFVGLYATLCGLLNSIISNIHEEVDDVVHKTKLVLLLIALVNFVFICLTYSDYKESMKDAEEFDKLVEQFLSVNDEKFEAELVDKEKCLRAVDYRLFKINKSDI